MRGIEVSLAPHPLTTDADRLVKIGQTRGARFAELPPLSIQSFLARETPSFPDPTADPAELMPRRTLSADSPKSGAWTIDIGPVMVARTRSVDRAPSGTQPSQATRPPSWNRSVLSVLSLSVLSVWAR